MADLYSVLEMRSPPQNLVKPMQNRSAYIVNLGYDAKCDEKILKSVVHDKRPLEVLRRYAPMVQYHMETVVAAMKSVTSDAEFAARIEPAWHNLLADFMHIYNPSTDASRCSGFCLKRCTTICIDSERNVYGCWLHGYMHACKRSEKCFVVQTNRDLSQTCVLSGRPLGYMMGNDASYRQSGGNKKQQFDYYTSWNRFQLARDTSTNDCHTDVARIARKMGLKHRTHEPSAEEKFTEEIALQESQHLERIEEYNKLTDSAMALENNSATPPPPTTPPAASTVTGKTISRSGPAQEIQFATAVDMAAEELERRRFDLTKKMERFALINSSPAVRGLTEQAMRIANRVVRTVIGEVIEDIHRAENRVLYNAYRRECAAHSARVHVRKLFTKAHREQTFVVMPDVWLILESFNREFVELAPFIKHEPTYVEGIVENISWLWDVCNQSPHVQGKVLTNSETGLTTLVMEGDSACSLRQFTLACLYHMRDGLTVAVPYSYTNERVLILAPQRALHLDLPFVESDVRYFGSEAMAELRRCIDQSLFDAAAYNLNCVTAQSSKRGRVGDVSSAPSTANKRQRKNTGTGATASTALSNSIAIERGIVEIKQRTERNSRSRKMYTEIVNMERSSSYSAGRVSITSNVEGVTTSLTEHQCTPFYMREPMLTSGVAQNTRRNVYCGEDIQVGRRFISSALASYEHRIAELK